MQQNGPEAPHYSELNQRDMIFTAEYVRSQFQPPGVQELLAEALQLCASFLW